MTWTIVWISLAALFGLGVLLVRGPETAIAYATGYGLCTGGAADFSGLDTAATKCDAGDVGGGCYDAKS